MKGVNPIIATVLLIALTVAVANILHTWMISLSKEQTRRIGNKTYSAIDCTAANVEIKDVYLDFSNNKARVVVWNSGQTDLVIESIVIFNNIGINGTSNQSNIMLPKGELRTIEINIDNLISTCTNFSQVLVTTNCVGISDKFISTPKGC